VTYDRACLKISHLLSRRNYDVGVGLDEEGNCKAGVFESSFRVGGASGPEVLALQAFKDNPGVTVVDASYRSVDASKVDSLPQKAVVLQKNSRIFYTVVNKIL